MRTEVEMMELIMSKAMKDDRIRAVTMDGSRANKNAVHDRYSDFDIVYFVTDVREFTKDKSWIDYFGDILIVQYPEDWYSHPYNYDGHETFVYLIQFADGNRIDLSIVDLRNIEKEKCNVEPRLVLLNKDNLKELIPVDNERAFFIKPPTKIEFDNTCNEFRWLSVYISKGLCREEFYYARYSFEVLIMEMFMKMLNWKIGLMQNFEVTTGDHNKYLKRFLAADEMNRLLGIFPKGEYEDMWNKLFLMYDYFAELETDVAQHFGFLCDKDETGRVREFLEKRRLQHDPMIDNELIYPSRNLDIRTDSQISLARNKWITLANDHNSAVLAKELYSEDFTYLYSNTVYTGYENLAEVYSYMNNKDFNVGLTPDTCAMIQPDLVFEIGTWFSNGSGKYIIVWAKQMGTWKILFDTNW